MKVACIVDVVVVPVVSAPRRVNGARSPRTAPATDEVVAAAETVQSACGPPPPPPPRHPDLLLPWDPTPLKEAAHQEVLLKAPDCPAKTDEPKPRVFRVLVWWSREADTTAAVLLWHCPRDPCKKDMIQHYEKTNNNVGIVLGTNEAKPTKKRARERDSKKEDFT